MGRPPSNGAPSFRFNSTEVAEMDSILQAHNLAMPAREILDGLAEKFSVSAERSGKITVQMKQVWNWFQNRRYALRAKATKSSGKLSVSPMPQAPQLVPAASATVRSVPQTPQPLAAPSAKSGGSNVPENSQMEFEAKSARDGAWYDVALFLSHRYLETGDPEVLVRFAGFGSEEDEWVNVRKHVRQRSLPCESSECVAVLPGDLILCFQEGKEQALYFDAHVLDAQRRRHDVRGCRCRFLVRYDHDQSEEIVPLRKVCRRPETDYRLQQLHAVKESGTMNQLKTGATHTGSTLRVYPPAEAAQKHHKVEESADAAVVVPPAAHTNVPAATETKVLQPKITDTIGATNGGNSNDALDIAPATSGTATNTITGDITSSVGNSNVAQGIMPATSATATNTITGDITSNVGNSNVAPDIMPATSGTATNTPDNIAVMSGTASNVENSNASRDNIASMSGITATISAGGSGENVPQG
ncbi:unnamed protein product [Ilex paraguariensis]|uniref:SAWADEE domain-containing protein n=1 Tax=Ilex paraguariensis TaxID=185542 RepID=A0ABC8UDT7_9AQUA